MQKLKIEQDFTEKAKLVQLELEREREKAKSEKEKYENEKAKLEHERKKLKQLQMEIWEREERNATALSTAKTTSNAGNSSNDDESVNIDKSNETLHNTSIIIDPLISTDIHPAVNTTSKLVNTSRSLATDNMAATVIGVTNNEQISSELHESIHSSEPTPALTNTELLEREKQLLLQKEKLDAMQAQLNGKLSGSVVAHDSNTSDMLQFVTEKERLEQQRILLERAKFSSESKER